MVPSSHLARYANVLSNCIIHDTHLDNANLLLIKNKTLSLVDITAFKVNNFKVTNVVGIAVFSYRYSACNTPTLVSVVYLQFEEAPLPEAVT